MHLNIYKLIWLKFGMMTDTTEVYILKLIKVTLTSNQGHKAVTNPKLFHLPSGLIVNFVR